jgi:hypothetical protein
MVMIEEVGRLGDRILEGKDGRRNPEDQRRD